jgi:hypothetical protein
VDDRQSKNKGRRIKRGAPSCRGFFVIRDFGKMLSFQAFRDRDF